MSSTSAAQTDPSGSGQATGEGPASWDVAFQVALEGPQAFSSPPVILAGAVYALRWDIQGTQDATSFRPAVLHRVDPTTAQSERLVTFEDRLSMSGLSSDGENLFVARDLDYASLTPAGNERWSIPFPAPEDLRSATASCSPAVFAQNVMFVACSAKATSDPLPRGPYFTHLEYDFVMALDSSNGHLEWIRVRAIREIESAGAPWVPTSPSRTSIGHNTGVHSVILGKDLLIVALAGQAPLQGTSTCVAADLGAFGSSPSYVQTLWAVSTIGESLWEWQGPVDADRLPSGPDGAGPSVGRYDELARTAPAAFLDGDRVFVKGEDLYVLNAETGCIIRTIPLTTTVQGARNPALLAASGDHLVVASYRDLVGLTRANLNEDWRSTPLIGGENFRDEQQPFIVGNQLVFATLQASASDAASSLVAPNGRVVVVNMGDGSNVWSLDVRPFNFVGPVRSFGVGDGLLVVDASDGPLIVIGHTQASIQLRAMVDSTQLTVGTAVVVDVGATIPGVQASDLKFRIEWGDGNATDWSTETRFEHAFATVGTPIARVFSQNSMGQTASENLEFIVTDSRPALPFWKEAFRPENQERTYFLLGLGATFLLSIGGLIFPLNKAKARIFGGGKEPKAPSRSGKRRK